MEDNSEPEWASTNHNTTNTNPEKDDEENCPALDDNRNTVVSRVSFAPSMSMELSSDPSNSPHLTPSSERALPHRLYRAFKGITVLTSLLLFIAQVVSVVYLPFDGVELVIKLFLSSFSVLVIVNEFEWWGMLRNSPLLTNWAPRGYFYMFIGIVSVEENDVKPGQNMSTLPFDYTAAIFIETASWMMVGLGAVYFIFGLCCGGNYINKKRDDYSKRVAERKRIFEQGLSSDTALSKQMIT